MVPTKDLRVKYVPIGDVRPYEDNPRRNDGAVEAVVNSLREFGWKQPIVVDSDLTPEQCAAYRLADNRVGELAEWDMDLLSQELDGLADLDMSAYGFDEDISSMEFMDFDGLGDGGGSRMQTGDKVRVVIGPAMFDIADPTHELYDACRDMDTERAGEFIERAIRRGEL